MAVVLDRPVAPQNPDDRLVPVPSAQEFAITAGIFGREDLGPLAPLLVPLIAPGRQHADAEAKRLGAVDDPVDVLEIGLDRSRWIVLFQRQVSPGVGLNQARELGQHDRLDHAEMLRRTRSKISLGIVAVEPVKQLPRRITQVEERLVELIEQEAPVVADTGGVGGLGCRRWSCLNVRVCRPGAAGDQPVEEGDDEERWSRKNAARLAHGHLGGSFCDESSLVGTARILGSLS